MNKQELVPAIELADMFDYNKETGLLTWKDSEKVKVQFRNKRAGTAKKGGYIFVSIRGKLFAAHRIILALVGGRWPPEFVDHVDGNTSNNSLSNLREATPLVNSQNVRRPNKANTTGYMGVTLNKQAGKYQAAIGHMGKVIYLGLYSTAAEAHEAYIAKKRELHSGCTI